MLWRRAAVVISLVVGRFPTAQWREIAVDWRFRLQMTEQEIFYADVFDVLFLTRN